MTDLYRYDGGVPAPLPEEIIDPATGFSYRAPFDPDDLLTLGYELAPQKPDDTDEFYYEWDSNGEEWVAVERPPVIEPPVVEPEPRVLGRLEFILLCQDAGGMTDQLLVEAQKNPAFEAFWIKFQMAQAVERSSPVTAQALVALEAGGYLPEGSQAVIDAWPRG